MAGTDFYTYVHRRLDTNVVFYVGKGKGYRAHDKSNRNKYWRHIATKCGFSVEIVSRFVCETEAFEHERQLIAEYRALGIGLANMTEGGEGQSGRSLSPEHRAKLSAALKGRRPSDATIQASIRAAKERGGPAFTPEQLAKAHAATRGVPSWNAGKQLSAEHRARIGAAHKGRPFQGTPGKLTAEARARAADLRRGKPLSEVTRARISEALKGKAKAPFSDETRARMSAAKLKYWAEKRAAAV